MKKAVKSSKVEEQGGGLTISPVLPVKEIQIHRGVRTGTKYQNMLDQMKGLKQGQSFTIEVPEGLTPRMFHNRLNAVIRRAPLIAPRGCEFVKRTTVGGQIAVMCVKKGEW